MRAIRSHKQLRPGLCRMMSLQNYIGATVDRAVASRSEVLELVPAVWRELGAVVDGTLRIIL